MNHASVFARTSHPGQTELKAGIRLSFFFHLIVAGCILFYFSDPAHLIMPTRKAALPPSLKVDLVALPDHKKGEIPSLSKLQEKLKDATDKMKALKVPEMKAPVAPILPKKVAEKPLESGRQAPASSAQAKEKLKNTLARIKNLSHLEKIANEEIKGNKISKGASLDENARLSDQENYYDHLREHIRENWTLPLWLTRQNLSARVLLYINDRGGLSSYKVIQSSGNKSFDDHVVAAIKSSDPYPVPEAKDLKNLSRGIEVRFPL